MEFGFRARGKPHTVTGAMRPRFSGGFTLIELLIVITIIAVLAAIAFPAFQSVQEKARVTQDLSNLRQVGTATQMYLNDNDGSFFSPTGGTTWMAALHPKYLATWKIFQSAFDTRSTSEDVTTAPISYGLNAHTTSDGAAGTSSPLLADRIVSPTLFVLFAPAQDAGSSVKFSGTPGAAVTVDKGGGSQGTAQGGTHNRRQRINACMADLHVENMTWGTANGSGFTNDSTSPSDPCGKQRWNPLATCP